MTTLLNSQAIPDSFKDESESSNIFKDKATPTSSPDCKPISNKELQLVADVLQIAELQRNTTMLLRQTASQQYKNVSEKLKPEANKPKFRKKSLKQMMQQSFFQGAYWMGSNFIA